MKFNGTIPPSSTPVKRYKVTKHSNGHWVFPEQMGEHVGFIYVIRDTVLKRFYLGKKLYYGTGQLNRGKESNWRKYTSSSEVLNELLKQRPREEFDFICIEQYKTKGSH